MDILIKLYVFMLGAIFGSFFNVCIYRIPKNISIVYPSSSCTTCSKRLKCIDLIPIVSFLINKGRCRYCDDRISTRYALVEFITAITFLGIYNNYGLTFGLIYYLTIASILIIITFIDIDHYIIPDKLIITGFILGTIFKVLNIDISIKESIIGFIVSGGTIILFVYLIEFLVKKEVMGRGDIKLFAMLGFLLGKEYGLIIMILSIYICSIYGIIIIVHNKLSKRKYNSIVPYGPFISMAAIAVIIYEHNIVNWYINIF